MAGGNRVGSVDFNIEFQWNTIHAFWKINDSIVLTIINEIGIEGVIVTYMRRPVLNYERNYDKHNNVNFVVPLTQRGCMLNFLNERCVNWMMKSNIFKFQRRIFTSETKFSKERSILSME
jgi:hypothetical protein